MLKLVGLFAVLGVIGCTKKSLEYGLDIKDTLRINCQMEPPTLDWTKMHDSASHMISENFMEGLTGTDYSNPELAAIPKLATKWETKDGRVWTFTLRKGVKWSDGVELTAQHVLDGIERLLNRKTASVYSYVLYPIKNGEAYFKGDVKDFSQVGVKINDKGQIVIELNKPLAYFPYIMGHQATYPIRKDIIAKYGEDKWADAGKMVTLGAYTLKVWDHDKNVVLERYDGYYGEKAKTKNVLFYMVNDYATAVNLYHSGKLDFQQQVPMNEVPILSKEPGFQRTLTLGTFYFGFNTAKPPFNNVKVRKAFAYAIDRKQITDLLNAGQDPLASLVPGGMFGHDPEIGLKFNPGMANKLLDEAGFKDRSKLPRITIGFNTDENHQRVSENVQAQLKKNLGVQVELANEEWKVYLNHIRTDPPNMFRYGWLADYPDPDTFLGLLLTNSENNYEKWSNKTFDDLVAQGATELNKEKRRTIYAKAQKIVAEDELPIIPVYRQVYNSLVNPRVKNFPHNALMRIDVTGASISQ